MRFASSQLRTLTLFTGVVGLLGAAIAPNAQAHGGLYRGPGPMFPPPVAGPGPGSGIPGTGGPGGGGGGGPTTPGGGAGSLLATRKAPAANYTDWYTWWEFNREPYLNLRTRLGSKRAITGVTDGSQDAVRPAFIELEGAVLPELLKLLQADDVDIVDSTTLALARVTPMERAATVVDGLNGALAHPDISVQQSAILALGVLGDPAAVPTLVAILEDSADGRAALRQKRECSVVQRGMAAISLGMIGEPSAMEPLWDTFRETSDSKLDLKASIVIAAGLFERTPFESVSFLREVVDDRRADEVVAAQAVIGLSRLGAAAQPMLGTLLSLAKSRKTANAIRQSAMVAIGKLAQPEDADAIGVLQAAVERDTDLGAANFAIIALGEIGARAAADAERHADVLKDLDRFLLRLITRPKKQQQLPFAVTAGALVARAYPPDHRQCEIYAEKLLDVYDDSRRPEYRASVAVSLGLMEWAPAGEILLDTLLDSADYELNGYLAEALGLVQHAPAAEPLWRLLEDQNDATYRVRLAEGLGLMGDIGVSDRLVKEMKKAKTLWVTASIAKGLGRVGDRGAIPPLLDIATDRSRPGLARAFGVVAIGLLAEKTRYPWNNRLRVGSNYLATFHVQKEVLDIL